MNSSVQDMEETGTNSETLPSTSTASMPEVPKEIDYSKPFMARFDAQKVGYPELDTEDPRDPFWSPFAMTHQLIDPGTDTKPERCIAQWHRKANAAWFPTHGFLKFNKQNPAEYAWTWKPEDDPFLKVKSMYFLKF